MLLPCLAGTSCNGNGASNIPGERVGYPERDPGGYCLAPSIRIESRADISISPARVSRSNALSRRCCEVRRALREHENTYGSVLSGSSVGLANTLAKHQNVPPQTISSDVLMKIHPSVVTV